MELNQLGNSRLAINPLAFGAWAIGGGGWGGNDAEDSKRALEAALANGLTTIDTAPIYGFGLSEEHVGNVVKAHGNRGQIQILTKCSLNWKTTKGTFYFKAEIKGKEVEVFRSGDKNDIIQECEESLQRLKTDYIDLYQVHRPDPSTPLDETMLAMEQLKSSGKIREGAVSNFSVHEMKECLSSFPIVSNQMPYSMLERGIENDIIPFCIENNIGVLAYSPLQRGVLTGKYTGELNLNEGDHRAESIWFTKENRKRINSFLDEIKPIAENYNVSLSQLVINWTTRQNGIECTLVGARNAEQTLSNIGALDFTLKSEELAQINASLDKLKLV